MDIIFFWIILFTLLIIAFALTILILKNKKRIEKQKDTENEIREFILTDLANCKSLPENINIDNFEKYFLDQYINVFQTIKLKNISDNLLKVIFRYKLDEKYLKLLKSRNQANRIVAASYLAYIPLRKVKEQLLKSFTAEKDFMVKLYMVNALTLLYYPKSIDAIVKSIKDAPDWYVEKTASLLGRFRTDFTNYLDNNIKKSDYEILKLIIYYSELSIEARYQDLLLETIKLKTLNYFPANTKQIAKDDWIYLPDNNYHKTGIRLLNSINNKQNQDAITSLITDYCKNKKVGKRLIRKKLRLFKKYTISLPKQARKLYLSKANKYINTEIYKFIVSKYSELKNSRTHTDLKCRAINSISKNNSLLFKDNYFLENPDIDIQKTAITALSNSSDTEVLNLLIPFLDNTKLANVTIKSTSEIIQKNSILNDIVYQEFKTTSSKQKKEALAVIISSKISYFLQKLMFKKEEKYINEIVKILISKHNITNICVFANNNKNITIQNKLLQIIINALDDISIFNTSSTDLIIDYVRDTPDEKIIEYLSEQHLKNTSPKNNNRNRLTEILKKSKENKIQIPELLATHKYILTIKLRTFLNDNILNHLKLEQYKSPRPKREEKAEKNKIVLLRVIHILSYVIFPLFYALTNFRIIERTPITEQIAFFVVILIFPIFYLFNYIGLIRKLKNWEIFAILAILIAYPITQALENNNLVAITTFYTQSKIYILEFNYYLIIYALSISLIYILLLYFSYLGVKTQIKYAKAQHFDFLFQPKILPSVSIIAPAYAEEETIIESVNSQLNLIYPDYELIIVSDGSPDNTLKVLIDYFELERTDIVIHHKIPTQPVRAVYRNLKKYPKLKVVDKINGGKADALNVGINAAQKDFFCGIDSDSLLEPEALIRLTSMGLCKDKESVAFGGNILPINNCNVEKGYLNTIKIPTDKLAAFQTIEYVRAFMAGRIGWAYLDALLIISGAFGLFKRERVIEIGGYLTSKSILNKDTVGEDMELVVRLNKYMLEQNLEYAIHYCYNANCWTEVPEFQPIETVKQKKWKNSISKTIINILSKIRLIKSTKKSDSTANLNLILHTKERMRILVNQRDRWHRGLIDILNFHKKMILNRKYKKVGMISLPYFLMFEVIGPLIEFQGYVLVLFAIVLGILNTKVALLLFISSVVMGIIISLGSLYILEKDSNHFTRRDIYKLILYAFIENFGPRQIASFWRIRGFFSAMESPKGWGKMIRKSKPIVLLAHNDKKWLQNIKTILEKNDFRTIVCEDGIKAIERIKVENVKLIIVDENIQRLDAFSIQNQIKTLPDKSKIPFVLIANKNDNIIKSRNSGISTIDPNQIQKDNNFIINEIKNLIKK